MTMVAGIYFDLDGFMWCMPRRGSIRQLPIVFVAAQDRALVDDSTTVAGARVE
jgi:hypothetical protein